MFDFSPDKGEVSVREHTAGRFLSNVLWSWLGVAVQILPGLIVTPYLLIKLGDARYGVWVIASALVGNYAILDLGFRSAVVRFAAHYRAVGEVDQLSELVSTTLLYFSIIALALLLATSMGWRYVHRLFQIAPEYRNEFAWLVLLSGISVAVGIVGGVFSGCVEGFHRFDIVNRIFIVTFGARSVGWFCLLATGRGLVSVGAWSLVCNVALVLLFAWSLFRIFPPLRISIREKATWSMFRKTAVYAFDTFLAGLGSRLIEQVGPLLIGHYRSETEVGYYTFPLRILQYGSDAVTRVGVVATPQSADFAARGETAQLGQLAVYANRYCLALFMPAAMFLEVYGYQLFLVCLRKPAFAAHSAPLLPALLVGATLAQTAQFCSSSILFGLGKQRGYALVLIGELIFTAVGTSLALPHYGLMGAAVVSSVAMVASRGIVTPLLLTRHLGLSYGRFMFSVLAPPILTSLPVWGLLIAFRWMGFIARNVVELAAVGILSAAVYFGACYFTCLAPQHRKIGLSWLERKLALLHRRR
jgi:O-antigen/teichoic acid export membrane protein